MDAVTAAAGVSKQTLYRYYETKATLFADVLGQLIAEPGPVVNDPPLAKKMLEDEVTAGNGAVPLFVVVLAALVLHDEPMTVNRLVGLGVGYLGVVVLVSRSLGASSSTLTGELALVLSTVSYGVGAVYARRNMRGVRPMIPALFQVGFAFVIVAVIALATERPWEVTWSPDAVVAVVWLGILGSGFAYLASFRLLSRIGATRTSLLAYLLPIVGIVSGALMFGEVVDARIVIGTVLIIAGITLVNSRFGQRRLFGRTAPSSEPG